MTTRNRPAADPVTEGEDTEDEGPPYGRLDQQTAAKCGLWLD